MDTKEKNRSEVASDIVSFALRSLSRDYPFLQQAFYMLEKKETSEISSICADYKYLYYNKDYIIRNFQSNFRRIKLGILHCVLHCLHLHPSMKYEDRELWEAAADMAVFNLINSAGDLNDSLSKKVNSFFKLCDDRDTLGIFKAASEDPKIKARLLKYTASDRLDNHSLWYKKAQKEDDTSTSSSSDGSPEDNRTSENSNAGNSIQNPGTEIEKEWSEQLKYSIEKSRFNGYGNAHGNMFASIEKPDRFSKFSYKEYIKRFVKQEITAEDPETLDIMMYTLGMELYDDMPIVEFSEVREFGYMSDVIIAIDMSGSCSGDIATNFLRQLYTLFEEMDIRSRVNIKVVTFDTEIMNEFTIKCREDAYKLIRNYYASGFGGTNFNCVFDYANSYSAHNGGKQLKALFFFSDAMGEYPDKKPKYKTTFFVPDQSSLTDYLRNGEYCFVPDWVELVHYNDEKP